MGLDIKERLELLEKKVMKITEVMASFLDAEIILEKKVDDYIDNDDLEESFIEMYDCYEKLEKKFDDIKVVVDYSGMEINTINITELKKRFNSHLDNDNSLAITIKDQFTDGYKEISELREVLRELWEVNEITLTENIDGESLDYYQQKKHKALEKLDAKDGEKQKALPEDLGMGFVVCPKCKEKFYLYRSDLK